MNLIIAVELALLAGLMWTILKKLYKIWENQWDLIDHSHIILHDLQQIKTRLHWSREREKKLKDNFDIPLDGSWPVTSSANKTTVIKLPEGWKARPPKGAVVVWRASKKKRRK